jgi:hypothetical protein
MKASDAIRQAYAMCDRWVGLIEDMRSNPLAQIGPNAPNHPLWVLGHVTVVEGRLHKTLLGTPNPVEHWKPLFDAGSQPSCDPSAYPSFDEVLAKYRELRKKTLAYLDELGEAGLDRPIDRPPPGLEKAFTTVGVGLMTIAMHQAFHMGEAATARRAAGKAPVFQPSKEFREF